MMGKNVANMWRRWMIALTVLSMSMIGLFGGPSVARADDPNAICVLNVVAEGKVFSILANQPENFNVAVALPIGTDVSAPFPCDAGETLALGVANQTNTNVNVAVQIFTHEGTPFCTKGPFLLAINGGRGFTFTDCQ